jgi:DNA-binding transcriptional LysR family regulator
LRSGSSPRCRAHASRGEAARLDLGALRDSPFVAFPHHDGTDFRAQLVAICAAAGFAPRVTQEVAPMHALIGLVGAGVGVAVVPDSVRKLRFAGVTYRALEDVAGARACTRCGGRTG